MLFYRDAQVQRLDSKVVSELSQYEDICKHDFSAEPPESLPGIDLNLDGQLEVLETLKPFYKTLPGHKWKRYKDGNLQFDESSAALLLCMLLKIKPGRVIEAGCGYSSAAMLDVNELFLGNSVKFTFIDINLDRLKKLTTPNDLKNARVFEKRLQDIPLDYFRNLEKGDVLFIDSSHCMRFNSDVNCILFEILPILPAGVYIHFHDIFYPFEYPKKWLVTYGWSFNEAYILRSFLQYNNVFKVNYFGSYLHKTQKGAVSRYPLIDSPEVSSLWLKKEK